MEMLKQGSWNSQARLDEVRVRFANATLEVQVSIKGQGGGAQQFQYEFTAVTT